MAINDSIGTAPGALALGTEREQWIKRAWDAIDESKLAELNRMMASIASPTGEEKQLAMTLVGVMRNSGIHAQYQPMDDDQGNSHVVTHSRGKGVIISARRLPVRD